MPAPLNGKPTFGAGRVFMTGGYANATPIRALVVQSQSIDFKRKIETLFGEKQLAEALGAGEMEVTGKVEYGKTVARVLSDLLFASGTATGSYLEADKEAGVVPATGPYTVPVVNVATWAFDLGVVNATTGAILTCVAAGSEVAGKSYSVAAGVYKFAAGDASANVYISYGFTNAAAGETVTLGSQLQGQVGSFQAVHVLPWGAEQDMFVLYNCLASSTGLSAKKSGFGMTSLDYVAAVNSNGVLGVATFAEAA